MTVSIHKLDDTNTYTDNKKHQKNLKRNMNNYDIFNPRTFQPQ